MWEWDGMFETTDGKQLKISYGEIANMIEKQRVTIAANRDSRMV